MPDLAQYLDAATRENTRRSYESAVRHFEFEWGGFLPATAEQIARYLADYADKLSSNTLKQRLAALAQWHMTQGFPDPTKAPMVRQTLKGIRTLHPAQEKRATPLQLDQLEQVITWLDQAILQARQGQRREALLRHSRDKALLLIGFWRGFRGDELMRLQVEFVEAVPGQGLHCFLPQSKGDRQLRGRTFRIPALAKLCPVTAYGDWIALAGLSQGAVFRGIDRWGHVQAQGLRSGSMIRLLRRILADAGLPTPDRYSGHSLRRGFAAWANANGWDLKMLMEYVGWRDVNSALRYLDAADPFASAENAPLPAPSLPARHSDTENALAAVPLPVLCSLELELSMTLTSTGTSRRAPGKARQMIEAICLSQHRMQRLDAAGCQYRLVLHEPSEDQLIDSVMLLLDAMHQIADNHQCHLEATLFDRAGQRSWD